MKNMLKPALLPALTLITGVLGLLLRVWLFLGGTDEKGLLVTSHPANPLLFILTALVLGALFLCVRTLAPVGQYSQLFPGGIASGVGCVAAAIGVLWVSARDLLSLKDPITTATLVLGVIATVSLLLLAWCRTRQARPVCYFHAAVTVYMMLHLVSQYRLWSAEPQLQVYFFPLMASVLLMLTTYHSAMLDLHKSSRKWFVFCNQAALFFCILSVYSESWLFYLTMAIWLTSGLCSLQEELPREEA